MSHWANGKRDAKRIAERFRRQFHSKAFVEFTQSQPCVACGHVSWFANECAHNPSRGAGGTWREISTLCTPCHREQHGGVKTFERKYGIDFAETNAAHVKAWEDYQGGLRE